MSSHLFNSLAAYATYKPYTITYWLENKEKQKQTLGYAALFKNTK